MLSHEEAQELHQIIGGAVEVGVLPDMNDLTRARELVAVIVADTMVGVEAPTPAEADARRRYIRGELDKVVPGGGQVKLKLHNAEGETFWLNISSDQQAAIENVLVPGPDTSINVYFTGDEDGPDLFGLVYDDEDSVLESAHENQLHGWRVPLLPLLDRAVRLDGDHDE